MLLINNVAWAGAIGATALLCVFNAAIAANLAVGKKPNCNCFGQLHSTPISWWTFLRNGTLIAPGGQDSGMALIDAQGNLWLFGGTCYDATETLGDLNDLWKYQP